MPTYAYACTECGHRFDIVQSFSDDSLTECPECEGPLRKLFSPVGVVFKGSGFYRTDSRSGSGKSSTTTSSTTSSSDSGSSTPPTSTGADGSSGSGSTPASGGSSSTGSSGGSAKVGASSTGS